MKPHRIIAAILVILLGLNGWVAVSHASEFASGASDVIAGAAESEPAHCAKTHESHADGHPWQTGDSKTCCLAVLATVVLPSPESIALSWQRDTGLRPRPLLALNGVSLPLHPRPPRA